jgi:hypothetical protein
MSKLPSFPAVLAACSFAPAIAYSQVNENAVLVEFQAGTLSSIVGDVGAWKNRN